MATMYASFRVSTNLYLLLLLFVSSFFYASSFNGPHLAAREMLSRRRVLEADVDGEVKVKNSSASPVAKPKKLKSGAVSEEKPLGKSKKLKNDVVFEDEQVIKHKKEKSGVVSESEEPVKSKKTKNQAASVDEQVVKSKKAKSDELPDEKPVVKPKKAKDDGVENKVKTKMAESNAVPLKSEGKAKTADEKVGMRKKSYDSSEEEADKKKKKSSNESTGEESETKVKKSKNTEETEQITTSKPKTLMKTKSKTAIEESSTVFDPEKQSLPKNKTKSGKSKQSESGSKSKSGKSQKKPSWMEQDDIDIVNQMRDFQSKFSQSIIPDMEKISFASKKYITRANKEMIRGIRPLVGYKHASTIASFVSFAFIVIPFLLVPLILNRIKAYFSLQKILVFIQAYLAIYFSILCLSSLVTGIDPLKFFYATSTSTYLCVMVLQTLAYVLYLLMLLMYLVLVFSTDTSVGSKLMGMGQAAVGFLVGLHFYMAVFHRVVLHQPPMTNWKTHGAYAACFMVICGFSAAEKRKKTYLEEGGEEGKKN